MSPRPIARTLPALATAALALAGLPGAAQAQTAFAAQTGVSTIYPCPSFCRGDRFAADIDGGPGVASSYSSVTNIDGNGQAQATLTGPAALPILKAEAYSTPSGLSQVQADATGMQGFYLGVNALGEYELNVSLTGQTNGTVAATVVVFSDADPASLPHFTTGASTLTGEIIPGSGDLTLLGRLNLSLQADGTPQSASGSWLVTGLATGDLIYVWAQVRASGRNGAYGDAFNTLNLDWTDATGLSQLAPVPEPATAASLLAGLALLAAARRRRR